MVASSGRTGPVNSASMLDMAVAVFLQLLRPPKSESTWKVSTPFVTSSHFSAPCSFGHPSRMSFSVSSWELQLLPAAMPRSHLPAPFSAMHSTLPNTAVVIVVVAVVVCVDVRVVFLVGYSSSSESSYLSPFNGLPSLSVTTKLPSLTFFFSTATASAYDETSLFG